MIRRVSQVNAGQPETPAPPTGRPPGPWLLTRFAMPRPAIRPVLAVGAESKGAFCFAVGNEAWLSRSFGPLHEPENYRAYQAGIAEASADLGIRPGVVARDLHPAYLSTEYAAAAGADVRIVQHHHAHAAACLAEHGITSPVIAICGDGAGCGDDKASWGCEIMLVSPKSFRRLAYLDYFGLPGGDQAAVECWRTALSLARQAWGRNLPAAIEDRFAAVPADARRVAEAQLARPGAAPLTSSLGRLFDGVAYLLGICERNEQEAQAACALQKCAEGALGIPYSTTVETAGGPLALDFTPALRALCTARSSGVSVAQVAADFHETVAVMLADAAGGLAQRHDLRTVVLSGGCFANSLLRDRVTALLAKAGLSVRASQRASCGDAGLPLGQAYVAIAQDTPDGAVDSPAGGCA
jgi:hydrogenase maturation protein HypF